MVDVDVSIGPLWIRRQLFEHSVAVPLLTASTAAQIDFPRLAAELVSVSVIAPPEPPAVTYDSWVAAAGLHARLDSSEHAAIIVEALETNVPDAFLRCNEATKLNSTEQLPYRELLIPVPELLAFIKLHAAATVSTHFRHSADAVWPEADAPAFSLSPASHTLARTSAPSSPITSPGLAPISLTPASPRIQSGRSSPSNSASNLVLNPVPNETQSYGSSSSGQSPSSPTTAQQAQPGQRSQQQTKIQQPAQQQQSPQQQQQQLQLQQHQNLLQQHQALQINSPTLSHGSSSAGGLDAFVRKKSPNHLNPIMNSQSAIIASTQFALERETRLVVTNLKALLLVIASAYRIPLDKNAEKATQEPEVDLRSVGVAESGTLTSNTGIEKGRRPQAPSSSISAGTNRGTEETNSTNKDTVMADGSNNNNANNKPLPASNIEITRQMFEHLSFLLTTCSHASGAFRPMSAIVPQWNDSSSSNTVGLTELVDIITTALTRIPMQEIVDGVIDMVEVSDLERKTIIRSSLPRTNRWDNGKPTHTPDMRISNCADAHLYLLCSLGRVSFVGCRGCTLFIGGCVSLSLINCENVRVHVVARVCRVTNCFDTHLYLCTNSNPQIVGENRGLVFAPYNAAYPKAELEKHLRIVGVDTSRNVWNKFYRPGFRGSSNAERNSEITAVVARTLSPEQFLPFAVPVRYISGNIIGEKDVDTNTEGNKAKGKWDSSLKCLFGLSVPLPNAYEEQLKQKRVLLMEVRKEIRGIERKWMESIGRGKDVAMAEGSGSGIGAEGQDAHDDDEESDYHAQQLDGGIVHTIIQDRFRDWLTHSGRIRQISDLVRMAQES